MQVTFYGVRGSIPTPGPDYVRYGGNTACVHLVLNDGTDIILDAGTGIRLLGNKLAKTSTPIHLLLTHNHWDHIQGFPFFAPAYQKSREIIIYPGRTSLPEYDQILQQMKGSVFPVPFDALSSAIRLEVLPEDKESWTINSAVIRRITMNHPGSGSAYLIEADGAKIGYLTDNELYPPYKKETDFMQFVDFVRDADLLIHDAQYMLDDMPAKSGWGHSVAEEAVKLAMAANVKQLALYSHDPERTDDDIDHVVAHCHQYVTLMQSSVSVFAAAEGQHLSF
ncbi:MBL fold metallo-hydrolase [Alteromonas sp. CYL-A6]|uniref:MBL fold metallo-hydrolase n=1 Tax=Alteromonas nitratireducens TaxID=3390813 RepID=UPI0034AD9D12